MHIKSGIIFIFSCLLVLKVESKILIFDVSKKSVQLSEKKINPDFLTLHISGGEEMLKAAVKNIKKLNMKTKILGVTLLTSLDGKDSQKIYGERDWALFGKCRVLKCKINYYGMQILKEKKIQI